MPTGYGNNPGQTTSGVQIQGQGGGDFATRYGYKVLRGRSPQDPAATRIFLKFRSGRPLRAAAPVNPILTFTINRDGSRQKYSCGNVQRKPIHGYLRPACAGERFAHATAAQRLFRLLRKRKF